MRIYQALDELDRRGGAGALCTIIETQGSTPRHMGSKMLVYPDGHFIGTIGGGEVESRVIHEALEAIMDGNPRRLSYNMVDPNVGDPGICGGQLEIWVEPLQTHPKLVVIGGGHVGKAVAHLAHWLGFRVAVSDDRPEYCTPESNPDADEFYPVDLAHLPEQLEITPETYLVLTTRGSAVDVGGLPALLDSPAAYIGLIGSKKRWVTTRKALIEQGYPEEKLDRVYSPIGLEMNAETPEEIAISILAEIILLRRGGNGKSMKM
ncbi:MAG: XdhC family protein [Anaerolineaceae bacterium]|nr:XdhC family protein [Anaerolineaceae bacterium]